MEFIKKVAESFSSSSNAVVLVSGDYKVLYRNGIPSDLSDDQIADCLPTVLPQGDEIIDVDGFLNFSGVCFRLYSPNGNSAVVCILFPDRNPYEMTEQSFGAALIDVIAHETATPVSIILTACSMLKSGDLSPDKYCEYIALIERSTRMLGRFYQSSCDWARLCSANKNTIAIKEFDLNSLVSSIVDTVSNIKNKYGSVFHYRLPKNPVFLSSDIFLIERIITNLISNSAESGAKNITIDVKRIGGRIRISIEDDGPGMEQTYADMLLSPESEPLRFSEVFKKGAGCSIVRGFCKMIGAELSVITAEGKGTCVSFTMPRSCEVTPSSLAQPIKPSLYSKFFELY